MSMVVKRSLEFFWFDFAIVPQYPRSKVKGKKDSIFRRVDCLPDNEKKGGAR